MVLTPRGVGGGRDEWWIARVRGGFGGACPRNPPRVTRPAGLSSSRTSARTPLPPRRLPPRTTCGTAARTAASPDRAVLRCRFAFCEGARFALSSEAPLARRGPCLVGADPWTRGRDLLTPSLVAGRSVALTPRTAPSWRLQELRAADGGGRWQAAWSRVRGVGRVAGQANRGSPRPCAQVHVIHAPARKVPPPTRDADPAHHGHQSRSRRRQMLCRVLHAHRFIARARPLPALDHRSAQDCLSHRFRLGRGSKTLPPVYQPGDFHSSKCRWQPLASPVSPTSPIG
ncbi:hypothetical protein DSM112329_03482 [Paraconexibacter sp. AEG42_29]|uniref:Uncharacterized protein n=1 Tax=Paraconexibacter sp. AEG42_29 TaxID=2997339 RepID=A0AAU7AY70_9ACTN